MSKAKFMVDLSQSFDSQGNLFFGKSLSIGNVLKPSVGPSGGISFDTAAAFGGAGDRAFITVDGSTVSNTTVLTIANINDINDTINFEVTSRDGVTIKGNKVFHLDNGGPNSGFNADMVDNFHASTPNLRDTLVVRNANAEISVSNVSVERNDTTSTFDFFFVRNSQSQSPSLLRQANISDVRQALGLNNPIVTNSEIVVNDGNCGGLRIVGTSPTITLQDTDGRTGYIHVNDSKMFFMQGGIGAGRCLMSPVAGQYPLTLNLANNDATFGGKLSIVDGQVTLGGNGFVRGIDIITDPTDATSKFYVDGEITKVNQRIDSLATPQQQVLRVKDEGSIINSNVKNINFTGRPVTVVNAGTDEVRVQVNSLIGAKDNGLILAEVDTINFTGPNVTVSANGNTLNVDIASAGPAPAPSGSGTPIKDEGITITPNVTSVNFVGDGVTVTDAGNGGVNVIIPGGSTGGGTPIKDEGNVITPAVTSVNFIGQGVTVTDAGNGGVNVLIPSSIPTSATDVGAYALLTPRRQDPNAPPPSGLILYRHNQLVSGNNLIFNSQRTDPYTLPPGVNPNSENVVGVGTWMCMGEASLFYFDDSQGNPRQYFLEPGMFIRIA